MYFLVYWVHYWFALLVASAFFEGRNLSFCLRDLVFRFHLRDLVSFQPNFFVALARQCACRYSDTDLVPFVCNFDEEICYFVVCHHIFIWLYVRARQEVPLDPNSLTNFNHGKQNCYYVNKIPGVAHDIVQLLAKQLCERKCQHAEKGIEPPE